MIEGHFITCEKWDGKQSQIFRQSMLQKPISQLTIDHYAPVIKKDDSTESHLHCYLLRYYIKQL